MQPVKSDPWGRVPEAGKVLVSVAVVALVTAVSRSLPINATTAGFAYLLAVLVIATAWGLSEAIAASLAGVLCFNYFFFPPVGTFTIADPQNWVALFAFLATAIVASELSARARRQTRAALERQRELERLYALSRAVLLDPGESPLARSLGGHLAQIFEFPAVALYDMRSGELYKAGPEDLRFAEDDARRVLRGDAAPPPSDPAANVVTIRLGAEPIGVLAVRGSITDGALEAVANLAAIGLERARTQEAATLAEAARQSEEFKSTVLDALAHEFKTPLTSIKAAATAVLAMPDREAKPQQELVAIIDEEADRLTSLVTEAIQMSRIEAGRLRLNRKSVRVAGLVRAAVTEMGLRLEDRSVLMEDIEQMPPVAVDSGLIELALRQLLDNASKYSSPGSPIRVGASNSAGVVVLTVGDEGPGIPANEQTRIFQKFYRGTGVRTRIPGSGIGLTIVREIVIAHGGRIWVDSSAGRGSKFHMELPIGGQEQGA